MKVEFIKSNVPPHVCLSLLPETNEERILINVMTQRYHSYGAIMRTDNVGRVIVGNQESPESDK